MPLYLHLRKYFLGSGSWHMYTLFFLHGEVVIDQKHYDLRIKVCVCFPEDGISRYFLILARKV